MLTAVIPPRFFFCFFFLTTSKRGRNRGPSGTGSVGSGQPTCALCMHVANSTVVFFFFAKRLFLSQRPSFEHPKWTQPWGANNSPPLAVQILYSFCQVVVLMCVLIGVPSFFSDWYSSCFFLRHSRFVVVPCAVRRPFSFLEGVRLLGRRGWGRPTGDFLLHFRAQGGVGNRRGTKGGKGKDIYYGAAFSG